MGDASMNRLSDAGSIPARSIKIPWFYKGFISCFFQSKQEVSKCNQGMIKSLSTKWCFTDKLFFIVWFAYIICVEIFIYFWCVSNQGSSCHWICTIYTHTCHHNFCIALDRALSKLSLGILNNSTRISSSSDVSSDSSESSVLSTFLLQAHHLIRCFLCKVGSTPGNAWVDYYRDLIRTNLKVDNCCHSFNGWLLGHHGIW